MNKSWKTYPFESTLEKIPKTSKIASSNYKKEGIYPIISQDDSYISGYWDNSEDVFKIKHPVVIFGDHTRIIKYVDFNFVIGADGVKVFSPISSICPKFFYYYLKSCNIPSLGYSRHYKLLKDIEIPVPSLPEQERIVAELDLLSGIIEKQKAQLRELDTLAQSIFYDMFGDPVKNEKGWKKLSVGDVVANKKQIARASKRFTADDIITYIDISAIDNTRNVITSPSSLKFGEAPSRAQQVVEKDDIVISLVRPNLNNVAIVNSPSVNQVASSGFCVLRTLKTIDKNFLFYVVKLPVFIDYLMQRVSGANYPAVREEDVLGYQTILPPINLQNEFSSKIEEIEEQKTAILKSMDSTEKLLNISMEKYFSL